MISFTTSSKPIAFSQEYVYACIKDNEVEVKFRDGRLFYVLRVDEDGIAEPDVHYCGDDVYEGRIVFEGVGRMKHEWRVHGPEKAYTIHTLYASTVQE
jgi:hypothetical protein